MKRLFLLFMLIGYNQSYAEKKLVTGEIVGRDLDIPGLTWAGHVGITGTFLELYKHEADLIFEALNDNPVIQYDAFPNNNSDGSKSFPLKTREFAEKYKKAFANKSKLPSINNITEEELNNLKQEEFMVIIDDAPSKITEKGAQNILQFSKNNILNNDKKLFLIDTIGFVGTPKMIPDLIEMYQNKFNKKEELSLKNQVLNSLQHISQNHLFSEKFPRETNELKKFYFQLLDKDLEARERTIVIRGIINFESDKNILNNLDKIISSLDSKNKKINEVEALKLKIYLFKRSPQLEKIMIAKIIDSLNKNKSAVLDKVFQVNIVDELKNHGIKNMDKSTKEKIKIYIDSRKSR